MKNAKHFLEQAGEQSVNILNVSKFGRKPVQRIRALMHSFTQQIVVLCQQLFAGFQQKNLAYLIQNLLIHPIVAHGIGALHKPALSVLLGKRATESRL